MPHPEPGTHREHWWFLLLAGVGGLLLLVLVPPGKPPDEVAHLDRIWAVAHGHLLPDVRADGSGGGPVAGCVTSYAAGPIAQQYVQTRPFRLGHVWARGERCSGRAARSRWVAFGNTAVNSPITYAPQAVVVAALAATGAPVGWLVLGGRLAALAAYLSLLAVAIRVTTRAKLVFVALGSLPAALGLASTLSSDTTVLGLAALSVALVLRLRYPAEGSSSGAERRLRATLAVVLLALVLAKNASGPFLLLWLLVPVPGGTVGARVRLRRFAQLAAVPVAGAALAAGWALQVRRISRFPSSSVVPTIEPSAQLSWMAHHPGGTLAVLWRTVVSLNFVKSVLPRVVGRYRSGRPLPSGALHQQPVPPWMLVAIAALLALAVAAELGRRRANASPLAPLVAASVVLTCGLLTLVLVYCVSSPPGWPWVALLEGRYFTPLLPLPSIALAERWEPVVSGRGVARLAARGVPALAAVVLAGELFQTVTMYYR